MKPSEVNAAISNNLRRLEKLGWRRTWRLGRHFQIHSRQAELDCYEILHHQEITHFDFRGHTFEQETIGLLILHRLPSGRLKVEFKLLDETDDGSGASAVMGDVLELEARVKPKTGI